MAMAPASSSLAQLPASPPTPPPDTAVPPPPPPDESGLTVRDSSVGYVDPAAPSDQVWLRADLGFGIRAPARAEFFYAKGLPRTESSVDFQDLSVYLEKTIGPCWSLFVEGGVRNLNPEQNSNAFGLGDMNLGFKHAFYSDDWSVLSLQSRVYLPTGADGRGLGTGHVSIEPALLGFVRLSEDLGLAGELRYWLPIDGTDFAGPVLRYGLGLRWDVWRSDDWQIAPVVEAIGWQVLDGQESRRLADGSALVRDAAGTSVLNLKVGVRADYGRAGVYVGYGRAITGPQWYDDIVRVEFRWLY
jgi:hypothetical protein